MPPLPAGWEETRDASGRPYYFNLVSGSVSWERPGPLRSSVVLRHTAASAPSASADSAANATRQPDQVDQLNEAVLAARARQGDRPPMTNETIRDAVKSFNKDYFKSPRAEAKWGRIADWNVSQVTDMGWLFRNMRQFNEDLSLWDVGNVTNMDRMFQGATSFNRDVINWDVGQVTNMDSIFRDATSFNGDVRKWDVKNVTTMDSSPWAAAVMFMGTKVHIKGIPWLRKISITWVLSTNTSGKRCGS